jgi:hypothetical protein
MEKLKILISKIEEKLSHLLMMLVALLLIPFKKIYEFLKPIFLKIIVFFSDTLRSCILGFKNFVQILNSMVGPRAWNYYRHKVQNFIQKVKEEKAEKVKVLSKQQNKKGNEPEQKKRSFAEDFSLLIDAFINRLSKVSPAKFAIMGMLFLVLLLNTFHFLTSSTDLATTIKEDKKAVIRRQIASTLDEIPTYYNDIARISSIKSLKIPAYASKINKIKNLEMDAHILFYNRTGKQFFDESMIIFLDHLEMSIEPIQPSFPLSPEGKMVIKEKIKYEIDTVFKNMGINSHVENVFFTNIFAN